MAVKEGVYKGRSAEERRAERRRRLVEATIALWGDPAGTPVTMTRVCAAAGLSERYFYEAFTHLDAALVAAVEQISTDLAVAATRAMEADEVGDPSARVRAGLVACMASLTDDPARARIAMLTSPGHPATRVRRAELLHSLRDLVVVEAQAVHGAAARTGEDARVAASMVIGGVGQLLTDWLEGDLSLDADGVVDAAERLWRLALVA